MRFATAKAFRSIECGLITEVARTAEMDGGNLPSLCYRTAGNFVAALLCETPAVNDHYGRDGVKCFRLLDLLSLTKMR
jgi:hypothetical protein